jgi:flagellar protein FliO/FliZ
MSALSGLAENRALMVAAGAVALFVAALLILLVFRLAFGRRLRMSGGRGRQLRLGIVDAFDLDRQRQLVIVRRDNVEHLIMIGGPNDVLIESEIVRAEARDLRETRARDKEARDKDVRDKDIRDREFKEPPQMPPLKAPEPKLPPPLMPEPQQPAAREHAPPVRLQPVSRAPVPPTLPPAAPPRRMPPRPDVSPLQPEPPRRAGPEPNSAAAPPSPPAVNGPPRFLRPARPQETPPKLPDAAPAPATHPSPASEPPAPDAMESLEEEMAKLLGRGPNKH